MRLSRTRLALLALPSALLLVVAIVGSASAGGRPLSGAMSGAAERPNPADADGSGQFALWLNAGEEEVCFELHVADIGTPTASHIHIGFADQAGPVVVGLTTPTADPAGGFSSSGCVTLAHEKIQAMLQAPHAFYVNVHNAEFPGGAIRGQLG
jgi:hypothetical protein